MFRVVSDIIAISNVSCRSLSSLVYVYSCCITDYYAVLTSNYALQLQYTSVRLSVSHYLFVTQEHRLTNVQLGLAVQHYKLRPIHTTRVHGP